jgi:hypothetical protein
MEEGAICHSRGEPTVGASQKGADDMRGQKDIQRKEDVGFLIITKATCLTPCPIPLNKVMLCENHLTL